MTVAALGFWFVYRRELTGDDAGAIADLLTDERWPWQPCLVRPTQRPGQAVYPWPAGRVARGDLRARVLDLLMSDQTEGANLATSRSERGNNAWFLVENGRAGARHAGIAYPFEAIGLCRTGVPAGKDLDAWLTLVRELAAAVHAAHGIVAAEVDERVVLGRLFAHSRANPTLPPDHPANESPRIRRARRDLGERYVRLPGWATFLRSAHVEAVGGRARLLAAVEPPVVHDVGDLLYVQLSTTVADALAPATEARRRALADLLAPITVPVVA